MKKRRISFSLQGPFSRQPGWPFSPQGVAWLRRELEALFFIRQLSWIRFARIERA